jgi:hypothetical protein
VRTDHAHYEPQLCGLEKAVRHRGRPVRRRTNAYYAREK